MKTTNRGFAIPAVYYAVAGAAALLFFAVPNLNPFHKKPAKEASAQVDLLVKQQAELDAARAELARVAAEKKAADEAAEAARKVADARRTDQLRQGQQYVVGAGAALNKIAPENRTAEIRIASDLNGRAAISLGLALGEIDPAKQAEIVKLVDDYVAGKEADVKAQLDAKDKEVQAAQEAKKAAEAERTAALVQSESLKNKLTETEKVVTQKDEMIHKSETVAQTLARKAAEAEHAAGSIGAQFNSLLRFVVLYLIIAWGLQLLAKAYPGVSILGRVSGAMLNPLRELEHRAAESFGKDMTGAVEDTKAWLAKEGYTADEIAKYESEIVHQWATVKDGTRNIFEKMKDKVQKELAKV